MGNQHIQKFLAGCIASLFIFAAGAASATTYIGGNIIMSGTTIEVLGPHADLDIQAIIDSITDASDTKPYLIKLGAGVYDLGVGQILMKNGVSIQGAGRDSTHIVSAASGVLARSSAVIVIEGTMASTSLTDVSVINNGGDDFAYGIFNTMSGDFRIERASIHASNANHEAIGIYNEGNDATPPTLILNSVDLEASSTLKAVGLDAIRMKIVMHDVKAIGDGTGNSSGGMSFASTTDTSIGSNVTAIAESDGFGLFVALTSVFLHSSALSGGSDGTLTSGALGLYLGSDETEIANSRIRGDVQDNSTSKNCFGNYDENMKEVRC